jgi:predicted nucleic acid-binding protein
MGQLTIPNAAIVYIDTSIVIYTVENHPDYWQLLQPLWLKLLLREVQIFSSELLILETLVRPKRDNNQQLLNDYERFLFLGGIRLFPISQTILREAAQLRATTNLRTPDAIHVATAINTGSTLFLTNDLRIRQVPNLSIIVLQDVLES